MGTKVALALLVLATAIIVSACGGTQDASNLAGTTSAFRIPVDRRGRPLPTDPHKSCDSQGVDSTTLRAGPCMAGGIQYVVANYGGVARLRTLSVAILSVSVAPGDAGHGRRVLPRRDAFLRVTLQVQNRDKVTHRFSYGQTMLGIGASNYLESVRVERNVHQESLAGNRGGVMASGETLRGDVLFDITEADYQELQRQGRFFIWNFGRRAALQIPRTTEQLGQIRLYAGEPS